jgi:hypothetical protein
MEIYENNYQIVYVFITYIFIIIGLLYLKEGHIPRNYIAILVYFIFKMVTLYDKCTVSYIECKLRNVKKEEGYLNDFLHSIVSLRYTNHAKFIYIVGIIFVFVFIKQEI